MTINAETTGVPIAPQAGKRRPSRGAGFDDYKVNWKLTVIMAVATLAIFIPLYLAIVMALKSPAQTTAGGSGFGLPWPLHFSNFKTAWQLTNTPIAFAMSALVTVISVAGELIVSSIAAWAIVRNWDHKLFRYSFFYVLAAMFIPFPVVALPQIKLMSLLSLDNPFGVAILHILFSLSFNILLYSAFVRSIPVELEESARMDGCSTWQVFWKVVFPLMAPMNATVGIFAFLQSWNDFMMPSLITANPHWQTLPVVQNIFNNQLLATGTNVAFASYLMAMIPSLLGYIIAQRWVMSGVMRGAIK